MKCPLAEEVLSPLQGDADREFLVSVFVVGEVAHIGIKHWHTVEVRAIYKLEAITWVHDDSPLGSINILANYMREENAKLEQNCAS